jgi:hypothetical protein
MSDTYRFEDNLDKSIPIDWSARLRDFQGVVTDLTVKAIAFHRLEAIRAVRPTTYEKIRRTIDCLLANSSSSQSRVFLGHSSRKIVHAIPVPRPGYWVRQSVGFLANKLPWWCDSGADAFDLDLIKEEEEPVPTASCENRVFALNDRGAPPATRPWTMRQ